MLWNLYFDAQVLFTSISNPHCVSFLSRVSSPWFLVSVDLMRWRFESCNLICLWLCWPLLAHKSRLCWQCHGQPGKRLGNALLQTLVYHHYHLQYIFLSLWTKMKHRIVSVFFHYIGWSCSCQSIMWIVIIVEATGPLHMSYHRFNRHFRKLRPMKICSIDLVISHNLWY